MRVHGGASGWRSERVGERPHLFSPDVGDLVDVRRDGLASDAHAGAVDHVTCRKHCCWNPVIISAVSFFT